MRICKGCGGVIGRDCFNPEECEWISRGIERQETERRESDHHDQRITDAEHMHYLQHEIDSLQKERDQLKDSNDKLLDFIHDMFYSHGIENRPTNPYPKMNMGDFYEKAKNLYFDIKQKN